MAGVVLGEPQPFLFLSHHAKTRPSAIVLSTFERDYSYAEASAYAVSIAALLRRRGVRPGHVVAAQLRNELNLLFMEAVYHEAAIWCSLGGTVATESPVHVDWLLSHAVTESFDPGRTIVVDEAFMVDVAQASFADPPRNYDSFESVCRITLSSGTTGRLQCVPGTVARQGRADAGWIDGWPFFSLIQGFSGSSVKIANACVFQGDTYICPGEPDHNVTLAQRNFVSTLQGSPVQLAEFIELLERRADRRTDIATVQYIGSALSTQLLARIKESLGASVTACYGSTEVGMIAMRRDVCDQVEDVGPPLPGVSVEVVDERDRPVPIGTTGVLRVRTERRVTGYVGAEPLAAEALRDGWFYPGDLARMSPAGHVVLAGRATEVINAGGVKFNPEGGDAVLASMAGVRDGAVIPFSTTLGITGYAAAVVVDAGFELATLVEPLTAACGCAPTSIFRIDSLGRDQNGKLSRTALAARVAALRGGIGSASDQGNGRTRQYDER
jgi:long-chain acyl-CoA synthetase